MGHNENQKALKNRHKCKYCSKGFAMAWALENHLKNCPYKENENESKNI